MATVSSLCASSWRSKGHVSGPELNIPEWHLTPVVPCPSRHWMMGRWMLLGYLIILPSQLWKQGHCHVYSIMQKATWSLSVRGEHLFWHGVQLFLVPSRQAVIYLMDMLAIAAPSNITRYCWPVATASGLTWHTLLTARWCALAVGDELDIGSVFWLEPRGSRWDITLQTINRLVDWGLPLAFARA